MMPDELMRGAFSLFPSRPDTKEILTELEKLVDRYAAPWKRSTA